MNMPKLQDGQPVVVAGAQMHTFHSEVTGRDYRIYVAMPEVPPPEGGFPVVYLLDGDLHFSPAAHYARFGAMGGELRPAVIVGIGYAGGIAEAMLARFTDLSLPVTREWIEALEYAIPGLSADITGGVDAFLAMIETELKAAIAGLTKVNGDDQILFGHSLGGLAVLRALFARPAAFRSFIASSPSIWWGDCAILTDEAAFAATMTGSDFRPRVMLAAGAREAAPEAAALRYFKSPAEAEAVAARARMVANAVELGARLRDTGVVDVQTVVFADEGHGSVAPAVLGRALYVSLGLDAAA